MVMLQGNQIRVGKYFKHKAYSIYCLINYRLISVGLIPFYLKRKTTVEVDWTPYLR